MADGPYCPLRTWPGSGPGQAVPGGRTPDPRRLEPHVGLVGIRGFLLGTGAVARRQLGNRVDHLPLLRTAADHEYRTRAVTGADEDVLGPCRTVEEVPRPQEPLLTLD